MAWTPWFSPKPIDEQEPTQSGPAERDSGRVYRYTDEIKVAINVAWVTGRPLLLRGKPGTGKSTLAKNVAKVLGRVLEEVVITSRTRKEDLLWHFDAVQRLADAQLGAASLRPNEAYVIPGPLWWAFDPKSALEHSVNPARLKQRAESGLADPQKRWVVLIDEIDKADPDVPNDLLGPIGSMAFWVDPLGQQITALDHDEEKDRPLVFITTNEERELPPAFVRRCVVLHLKQPTEDELVEIVDMHFRERLKGSLSRKNGESSTSTSFVRDLAKRFIKARDETHERSLSTAEFIDAVDAALDLHLDLKTEEDKWQLLEQVVLRKTSAETLGSRRT